MSLNRETVIAATMTSPSVGASFFIEVSQELQYHRTPESTYRQDQDWSCSETQYMDFLFYFCKNMKETFSWRTTDPTCIILDGEIPKVSFRSFLVSSLFLQKISTRSVPAKSVVTVSHKITEKNTWPQPSRHKFQSDNHYKQQPPSYLSIWCIFSGKYERKTMNLIDSLMFSILAT